MARGLRERLVAAGRSDLLAGTRFMTPEVLAAAVLHRAGVAVEFLEDELRPHRIAQLIADGIDPPGLGRELLQETVGWAAALATTIGELERADLRPSDLPTDDVTFDGIRMVWNATDTAAGASWTVARALGHAARLIGDEPTLLLDDAAFLAIVPPDVDAVVGNFVRALPRASVALLAARPMRARAIDRLASLFGETTRDRLVQTHPKAANNTDLGVAAAYLFAFEQGLSARDRQRAGRQPDGTLTLEEYDGVAAEIDAAVDWVVRRILDGVPLERIAVLTPGADPWCSLLAARLSNLGTGQPAPPIRVAGGVPLLHSSAGARIQTIVRALQHYLGPTALIDVLCIVRCEDETGRRPSRARIQELVFSLGTRGGSPGNPGGALEWRPKIVQAETRLSAAIPVDITEEDEHAARRRARMLSALHALRGAVEGLCDLAEAIGRGVSLQELRPLFVAFIRDHVAQPGDGPRTHAVLDDRLEMLADDVTCGRICGPALLDLVADLLTTIGISDDATSAAVYVGTVSGAAGLSFEAVRIIGLTEGSIPTTVRGDPVLPDELRSRITPLLVTGPDRALASLQRFDLVVRGTTRMLSLSASRLAVDRTVREPSSLFVEVGAALGRDPTSPVVPSLESLRRTEIWPCLALRERTRIVQPLRPSDWHDRLASGHFDVPRAWCDASAIDLPSMIAAMPAANVWHAMDGAIGDVPGPDMLGLTASHPTSAWRLAVLLRCPHRFLYEHILDWEEPAEAPPGHEVDPATFGGLVHAIAETFFRAHGVAFGLRRESLERWREIASEIASAELSELLVTYGLDSDLASSAVLRRLQAHVDRLLEHAWSGGPRRFVAAEWSFGNETPIRLSLDGGELFVRGRIDLIEAANEEAFVSDIKTGKCTPRRGENYEPRPTKDLQIGLYAHILAQSSPTLDTPTRVGAAYVHTDDRKGAERSFVGPDGDELRDATLGWLATARGLLEARAFPRTPDHADCNYCPFQPVCGDEMRSRSTHLLATAAEPVLVRYRTMKVRP